MNIRTFFIGALLVAGALPLTGRLLAFNASELRVLPEEAVEVTWPTHFRDQPLTQHPLGALEQRFARQFPGAIARFTDGHHVLIVRHVTRATRQLHPAEDCFRALGYAVERPRPVVDDHGVQWSCFNATLDGRRVRVCERIEDQEGRQWIDTSAWFWAAQYGGGPWRATTVVSSAPSSP